ncbi:hypothetical protein [Paenibacillus senegalensis]|uniref:hypothetical protein n=1 Tax=Paenibacillus senegalensis TaxID=1465766 RepID=UPI00292A42F1|nr:hypothetical protein [Paenibacillus senegalensis]
MFGHLKGNRTFRRFSLRGLDKVHVDKVHVEFGIVALAHNLLKVAGIRLATFLQKQHNKKSWMENIMICFSAQLFILGTFWTASTRSQACFQYKPSAQRSAGEPAPSYPGPAQ